MYRILKYVLNIGCYILIVVPVSAGHGLPQEEAATEMDTLTVSYVIEQALLRNPGWHSANYKMLAANEQEASEGSWEDPMVKWSFAPRTIGENRFGSNLTLSQRIPFPGKKSLSSDIANKKAGSIKSERNALALNLSQYAVELYNEYYFLHRSIKIQKEFTVIWEQIEQSTESAYKSGRGSAQDPLQAIAEKIYSEIELDKLESKLISIKASLKALLHLNPESRLSPPPNSLDLNYLDTLTSAINHDSLLRFHPEIKQMEAQIESARLTRELTKKQYWPDLEISGQYNTMWMNPDHRLSLGVGAVIPLQWGKRRADFKKSSLTLKSLEYQHIQHIDRLTALIKSRTAALNEATTRKNRIKNDLVPALEIQVAAAHSGYKTGSNNFSTLVQAESKLLKARLSYHRAVADAASQYSNWQVSFGKIPFIQNQGDK